MVILQGGANLVSHPPAFSNNGKLLLVCTGSTVTVLSVATTLPVLQLKGHTDTVTSISVVPAAPGSKTSAVNHAWTSSLDGSIRLWDCEVGNTVRTITVGKSIESMVIPSLLKGAPKAGKPHDNIALISVRWEKETQSMGKGDSWTGRVILFNLSTGKPLQGHLAKTLRPQPLVISPHGNLVGMPDKRKIWVWRIPDGAIGQLNAVRSTVLHHTKGSKVMAFDPTETVLAGGDETGRILCWYNVGERTFSVNSSEDKPPLSNDGDIKGGVRETDDAEACTTYHWHANEVKSLLYSADGTYLFSGGAEGTLVIWQTETGKQQFLPRLGGQLNFITPSPDPSEFAISCSDNAIRFVNIGTMNVEKSCQGIKPVVPMPNLFKTMNNTRVAFSPQGGKLVLPTDNVALQFYDTVRDCELFEVPITPRTNISGADNDARDGWSGPSTFVTHVTFSTDGSVMATVDVRLPEGNIGGGACLKFWRLDSGKQNRKFVLNTMVDEPHGADITALLYHPFEHMVVSCSVDSTFKVWVTTSGIQENTGKVSAWRCRSVGSYRHKEMYSAAFSPDGSLLGVATEELVTLWNPYSNGFVTSLACVPSPQKLSLLAFVHNSKCLVAASSGFRPRLVVWHLPTLSVLWSCRIHVEALSVDPRSSHFGIIALAPAEEGKSRSGDGGSRKAAVALFSLDSPTPIAAWSIQKGAGGALFFASSNLLSSSSLQLDDAKYERDASQSSLVVLTGSREYVVLNPYSQEDETETILTAATPLLETAPSAFVATYGKPVTPSNKGSDKDVVGIRAAKPWGDLLNASSHVFPSLTRISLTFMESLLLKNSDVEKPVFLGREPESLAS